MFAELPIVKYEHKGDHDHLVVFPIGDIHLGSPHFNPKHLMKVLREVEANRENARIVILGDVIENATKRSVGAGVYEQVSNPLEQVKKAVEIFRPYADLIDGVVTGNHELRAYKDSGIDLMEDFCARLGIEDKYLGYSGIVVHSINKRAYVTYVWHGAGGGAKPGGNLNRIEEQVKVVEGCDIYLCGHVHKKIAYKKTAQKVDTRNMQVVTFEQTFVVTGSSLEWSGSYAQAAGLAPSAPGYPKLILNGRMGPGGRKVKEVTAII